ncbi:hypothetical protein BCR44DRAFT_1438840, partial [Catenaria anguillulae PL171]
MLCGCGFCFLFPLLVAVDTTHLIVVVSFSIPFYLLILPPYCWMTPSCTPSLMDY